MSDEIYRKIFARNLSYYMNKNEKTQTDLINDLNLNKSAISTWVNATRMPRMDKVQLLADYFHINKSDLLEEKPKLPDLPAGAIPVEYGLKRKIPIYGRVAAGPPSEMFNDTIGFTDIDDDLPQGSDYEYFALKIKGHSMEPDIKYNDLVIIRRQPDINSGEIAIVAVNGEDATCKKIMKQDDGILLMPTNTEEFKPIFYTNKQIETLPVTVIGKVVQVKRNY